MSQIEQICNAYSKYIMTWQTEQRYLNLRLRNNGHKDNHNVPTVSEIISHGSKDNTLQAVEQSGQLDLKIVVNSSFQTELSRLIFNESEKTLGLLAIKAPPPALRRYTPTLCLSYQVSMSGAYLQCHKSWDELFVLLLC